MFPTQLAKSQDLSTGALIAYTLIPVLLSIAILPAIFILSAYIARRKIERGTSPGIHYTINSNELKFTLRGWQCFFTFKRSVTVPVSSIQNIERNERISKADPNGIKWAGTHLPGAITAGAFKEGKHKEFWYVVDPGKAVVIDLKDHSLSRIVIQVDDPEKFARDLATSRSGPRP